jgi:hypothetical protein
MPPPADAGAAPAEGAGDEDAALEQMAQVLAENGVTSGELEQMMQIIVDLKESGKSDEEIVQALSELADEAGAGGAPGAEAGMPPPAEPPMAEKSAADVRKSVDSAKQMILARAAKK